MKKILLILCLMALPVFAGYNPKWINLNKPYDTGIVKKDSGETFNFKFEFQKSIGTFVSFDYTIGFSAPVTIEVDNPPTNVFVDSTTYTDKIVVDCHSNDVTDQIEGWLGATAQMGTEVQYVSEFVANSIVLIKRAIASTNLNYQYTLFTPGLTDVLPGEKIYLEAELVPNNLIIVGYNWTIEGTTFKSSAPTVNNSNLVELVPIGDLDKKNISFYWCDSGNPRKVTANISCKIARLPIIKNVDDISNFNVGKPIYTNNLLTNGTPQMIKVPRDHDDDPMTPDKLDNKLIYADAQENHGFVIEGKVDVPNGFAEGKWQYVQVLKEETIWWPLVNDELKKQSNMHGETVLDTNYPYAGPYDTGVKGKDGDRPENGFEVWVFSGGLSYYIPLVLQHSTNFQMNIEFKPAGLESVFVPIQYVKWRFKANINYDANEAPLLQNIDRINPLALIDWGANLPQQWEKNIDINHVQVLVPAP